MQGRRTFTTQRGSAYVVLLIAIALSGTALAGVGRIWALEAQRERERELLFIGEQFRRALGAYHAQSPGRVRQYPADLADLVEDGRFPEPRRHLRRIWRDPITGSTDWGVVRAPDGRIVGVHSRSEQRPLKRANFRPRDEGFEGRSRYADWIFGVPTEPVGSGRAEGSVLSPHTESARIARAP